MKPFSESTTGDTSWSRIFSDCIKDALGNQNVVDFADTYNSISGTYVGVEIVGSYLSPTASFLDNTSISRGFSGSMGDDYVRGHILFDETLPTGGRNLIAASHGRGRLFSKLHASEIPPLSQVLGSTEVNENPSLAYREVPWSERVSRSAYRFTQHFDGNERYYDSCLPDIGNCFAVNGCSAWVPYTDPITQLSPRGNIPFTSGSVLLIFNGYEMDRNSQGYTKDPLVNNEWSWSYPYESKYAPELRYLKIAENLGLPPTKLSADWGLGITDGKVALEVGRIETSKIVVPTDLIPILPGYIEGVENLDLVEGFTPRNSFRKPYRFADTSGSFRWGNTGRYEDTTMDTLLGVCNIIPTDVNLARTTSPSNELLTGSMFPNDMIKFLFGFGDLNNMTHGYMNVDTGSYISSTEVFDILGDGYQASAIIPTPSLPPCLTVNWANSPTVNGWSIVEKEGYQDFFDGNSYNYYNMGNGGPGTYLETETTGFLWPSNNTCILKSDTITNYSGGTMDPGTMGTSICSIDITSSFPWSIKYTRGLVAPSLTYQVKSGLLVYFSGTPNLSSGDLPDGPFQIVAPLEFLTGSVDTFVNSRYTIMSEFDSLTVNGGGEENLFSPGEWRLNFSYVRGPQNETEISLPHGLGQVEYGAAIDDLEIRVYDSIVPDETAPKLGGNNYPHFRRYKIDPRSSPTYSNEAGYSQINRDISTELYRGYIAAISPVIRGWKYGLVSGFPMSSRCVWRRNSYGQFRDMLEQRPFTKFIASGESPFDGEAIATMGSVGYLGEKLKRSRLASTLGDSPVSVNFVQQYYEVDARGIGAIYNKKVNPSTTLSYNLSSEATSSFPYKEGNSYFAAPQTHEAGIRVITPPQPVQAHRVAQRNVFPPPPPQKIEVFFGSNSTVSTTDKPPLSQKIFFGSNSTVSTTDKP
jgi:hypothetical protein